MDRRRVIEDCPAAPGAYVLAIELGAPLPLALPRLTPVTLAAGRYLYCGSARGPGGLRARLARHFRPDKAIRWHVDRLTAAGVGTVLGALAYPDGDECALAAALADFPVPLTGFGSGDCHLCRSHLVSWPRGARSNAVPLEALDRGCRAIYIVPPLRRSSSAG
ncbi:MAG: GIY-YIG nuclease family protein [Alphaproteobacteria bacterium]|nr:GIY-YIG nuclease family protein [Alphaproteobacteria bacterium]